MLAAWRILAVLLGSGNDVETIVRAARNAVAAIQTRPGNLFKLVVEMPFGPAVAIGENQLASAAHHPPSFQGVGEDLRKRTNMEAAILSTIW